MFMDRHSAFFRPGGTLEPGAESYIVRKADEQLLEALIAREYVFLLDSRQKGKSSLIARAILRLKEAGVRPVKLDLQRIGANVTPEQWYAGLIIGIGQELGLQQAVLAYWQETQAIGPLARFVGAIQDVVLAKIDEPLVIFIDEIDFVRALSFSTDEFFAAIRECFNRRSSDGSFKRLTYCLVGVATPGQLIRNPDISPFNIGVRIELTDFSVAETAGYAPLLDSKGRDGTLLVERVHYWLGGHPYLTQLLCSQIACNPNIARSNDVDRLVREMFLSPEARQREPNLSDVERRMLNPDVPTLSPEEARIQVLELYGRLLKSSSVDASEQNPVVATLRLSGVADEQDGQLHIRNRLYRMIFNAKWRQSVLPEAEVRRSRLSQQRGAIKVGVIAIVIIAAISLLATKYIQLAEERNRAVLLANSNADRAEQEAYIRTLSLMDSEARDQKWLRVRQLLDKSRDSRFRGWEWDYWDLRLNGYRKAYQIPTEVATIVPTSGGDAIIGGNGYLAALHDDKLTSLHRDESSSSYFSTSRLWVNSADGPAQVFDASSGDLLYSLPPGNAYCSRVSPYVVLKRGRSLKLLKLDRAGAKFICDLPSITDLRFAYLSPKRWVCLVDMRLGCTVVDRMLNRTRRFESDIFESPTSCTFSSNEKLAYFTTGHRSVSVFDLERLTLVRTVGSHHAPIQSAALSSDERRLLTASLDGTAELIDLPTNRIERSFIGHDSTVTYAAFSNDERQVLTGTLNGEIRLWDIDAPSPAWTLHDHHDQINDARLNHDASRLITTSNDGNCFVYDTVTRRRLLSVPIGAMPLPGLLRMSDNTRFAYVGGAKGEIWCIDLVSASIRWKSTPCQSLITSAALSRNGARLVVGDYSGVAAVLAADSGEILIRRNIRKVKIAACQFSPDGTSIAVGSGNSLLICRTSDLQTIRSQEDNISRDVRSVEFAPNNQLLVCRSRMPFVMSYPDLKVVRKLNGHTSRVFGATLSHSGKLVATHSFDGTARIFNFASGALLQKIRHDSWVSTVEFSADDSRIITSSDDFTSKIWSVATGEQITQLPSPESPMFCASFSADQSTVVTGAQDGTVSVFFTRRSLPWRHYVNSLRK